MSAPAWSSVDDDTADLLTQLAEPDPGLQAEIEWSLFLMALVTARTIDHGLVRQNTMRPMIRGKVAPRRVGPFYRRACLEGLIAPTGGWETSDDTQGRNAGRPCRDYRWLGAS